MKPGYTTTEFWTTLFTNLLGVVQLTTGAVAVNNKYVALAMAINQGLYSASRGLAKSGNGAAVPVVIPADQGDAGQPAAPGQEAAEPAQKVADPTPRPIP